MSGQPESWDIDIRVVIGHDQPRVGCGDLSGFDRRSIDLPRACAHKLRLPERTARRRLISLATLVTGAGVDWLDDHLAGGTDERPEA